jgi:sugar phosphate isomerase/epimerase
MGFRNVVNDGSSNPPRLRMQQSAWALMKLPRDGAEWSITERLDRIAAAGFTGLDTSCTTEPEADELGAMLSDRGLASGFWALASEADDLLSPIELAHRMRAQYLSARVTGSLKASPEIADILEEMFELVNDAGLPLFIETHRGTVTQDLRRTVKVIDRFKKVRFTGDFSHYALAGELNGTWSDEVWDHFRPIAARCSHWHGRISFGEQAQNDIGDGRGELAQQFKKLWSMGMAAWLKKSQPGDVLPFTCELGPAPYAITDLSGRELVDRWEQSLIVKRLAEEAWSDAEASIQPAEPQPALADLQNSTV